MRIDMSSGAVTLRLRQAAQLRQTCLALAKSSASLKIRKTYSDNKSVQRISLALGR